MPDRLSSIINPSPLMRPAPFWSWNDKLDEAELRRQIREMAEKGWGSYFMHSRVGLVTEYLSDEWMRLINACLDEAQKTGTYAWIYDEDKWPSGYAAGVVPEKDEAYRSRALVLLKKGAATPIDTVLSSARYGGIDYDICKRVSALDNPWFNGTSYVDLMNPEAVREFINVTHEKYKLACGEHFGKTIPGIFTDEPCYLFSRYDAPVVPWSEYLPGFFREMKGYDILEHIPKLFFDIEDFRKIRFDFYDAATELFKQSFTKQYYDWCTENGLIMTGHYIIEDTLREQVQWSGDVMSQYEHMHWPGIDKLGRNLDQTITVKQVSSAADQLGKERIFCEVFGAVGGQVSFFHRKWIADWQAALGINFVNQHLSLYSMRGERKRDCPANLFYQQPWWEDERGFSDYLARMSAAVTEGERLVDILVVQPISSVWCEYSPLHASGDYALEKTWDEPFAAISRRLMEEKLDYHYGNETLMSKHGSVEGSKLKIGKYEYPLVIVPPAQNLRASTVRLLRSYVESGGRLIFVGGLPSLIDGEEASADIAGAEIALDLEEAIKMASESFPGRVKVTDKLTGKNAARVYVHARRAGDEVRYLIVNTDDKREVRATIELPNGSTPISMMDLSDGSVYGVKSDAGGLDVTLYPAGSLLLISGHETSEAAPVLLGSGASLQNLANLMPAAVIDSFNCEPLEENVLLLNDFELALDGKKVYEGAICGSWHPHFYAAPDGTPFRAQYSFYSEDDIDDCFAAIEVAENLDAVTFNGAEVMPLKSRGEAGELDPNKSWKDINFTRVPLPTIKRGINTLVIEGRKCNNITEPWCHIRVADWQEHQATEAEEVYICGRFSVRHVSEGRYVISAFKEPAGRNLTYEGFPFYCGRALLSADISVPEVPASQKSVLMINDTAVASITVRVNGIDCGTLRWPPFVADVSNALRPGSNKIELEIATTLVNAFGPNRIAGTKEQTWVSPLTFIELDKLGSSYELFDFGVGSASLVMISTE